MPDSFPNNYLSYLDCPLFPFILKVIQAHQAFHLYTKKDGVLSVFYAVLLLSLRMLHYSIYSLTFPSKCYINVISMLYSCTIRFILSSLLYLSISLLFNYLNLYSHFVN